MFENIQKVIGKLDSKAIPAQRQADLLAVAQFIQQKKDEEKAVLLNFICTHNSRRSQFSQIWAQVAAAHHKIKIESFSGGVEETAFNERAIASLERFGFEINKEGEQNPKYAVKWDENLAPLVMFSKMYDDAINPSSGFAAIMTCSDADENCPFVAGCEKRFPIRYEDPKHYDDTPLEMAFYDYRSFEIANELFFLFSKIN